MAANQTGIGTDGFRKSILRAFYSVFHLRGGQAALLPCLDLEGQCAGTREQHYTKAIDQLLRHLLQIPALLGHTVVYPAPECIIIQKLHSFSGEMVGKGLEDILRGIRPGGKPINGIGIEGKALAGQLPGHKIPCVSKQRPDILICEKLGHRKLLSVDGIVPIIPKK